MISKTLKDTEDFAKELLNRVKSRSALASTESRRGNKACIISLKGDLGSGKTALTKAIAKTLGIKEDVLSPTYVIQKEYEIGKNEIWKEEVTPYTHLVHIDAYRIEDRKELEVIGWGKTVDNPQNLIIVEWPEKAGDLIKPDITVKCQFVDDTTRIYTIEDEK